MFSTKYRLLVCIFIVLFYIAFVFIYDFIIYLSDFNSFNRYFCVTKYVNSLQYIKRQEGKQLLIQYNLYIRSTWTENRRTVKIKYLKGVVRE